MCYRYLVKQSFVYMQRQRLVVCNVSALQKRGLLSYYLN